MVKVTKLNSLPDDECNLRNKEKRSFPLRSETQPAELSCLRGTRWNYYYYH